MSKFAEKKRHVFPVCEKCIRNAFGLLSEGCLGLFHQNRTRRQYEKGEVLFYEGTPPLALFLLCSGRVKVSKLGDRSDLLLRLLGPGELVGYRAVFSGEPYAATATAVEKSEICIFPRATVLEIVRRSPESALYLLAKIARELRISEEQAILLSQKRVRLRIARLLLLLLDMSDPTGSEGRLDLPLMRREMAEMAGTTPETLSRQLKILARQGVLQMARSAVFVKDLAALRRIAS